MHPEVAQKCVEAATAARNYRALRESFLRERSEFRDRLRASRRALDMAYAGCESEDPEAPEALVAAMRAHKAVQAEADAHYDAQQALLSSAKEAKERLEDEVASGKFQRKLEFDEQDVSVYRRCAVHRTELFENRFQLSPRTGKWCPVGHVPKESDVEVVVRRTGAVEYRGDTPTAL